MRKRYPASLTKLMTLYLLFDAMKKGQVTLQTPMTVSAHAAGQSPVKLYMQARRHDHGGAGDQGHRRALGQRRRRGHRRKARRHAKAISPQMMTAEAHKLGMATPITPTPRACPTAQQITTATDLGLLARHIAYDFPQYYHFFATPSFTFHGHTWSTHDNLIGKYKGADGMKTGYTVMSGFNLVSSVVRNGAHVIGVVMGGRTAHKRDREMKRLLNQTFARIEQPADAGRPRRSALARDRRWRASPTTVIAGFEIGGALVPLPKARTVVASACAELQAGRRGRSRTTRTPPKPRPTTTDRRSDRGHDCAGPAAPGHDAGLL